MRDRKSLTNEQKERARQLRRAATFPERLLWGRLRAGRLAGIKFRRQHTIESFVVDFYCHEARLAIELDGDSHAGRGAYDADRTAQLAKLGVRVVRIANDDVLRDLDAVLELIVSLCGTEP
jgi:very-short-patch-repair endonuclease